MELKIKFSYWFFIIVFFHLLKCADVNRLSLLNIMRYPRRGKFQPTFDERMPLRIRAIEGATAFLTCIVKNIGNESVSWIRNQDLQILSVNDYVFTGDSRFHIVQENSEKWMLKINHVRSEDNGIYECQISTQPVTSFSVYLSISGAGIRNNWMKNKEREQKSFDLINDGVTGSLTTSQQNSPHTKILQGTEIQVNEGSPLQLTCEVTINPERNETVTNLEGAKMVYLNLIWLHNNKILNRNSSHEGTIMRTALSSKVVRSKLIILKTLLNDSGEYICHPFVFTEAVIMVYITNGKTVPLLSSVLLLSVFIFHKIVKIC